MKGAPCRLVFWVAVDVDGSRHGLGDSPREARDDARRDYLRTMRTAYGPFRRYTRACVIAERGPTSWTDGDCAHDSPEAVAAWADGLAAPRIEVRGATEQELLLALCAVLQLEGGDVPRHMRRIVRRYHLQIEGKPS